MTTDLWGKDTVSSSMLLQHFSTGDVRSFEARIDLDFDALHPVNAGKSSITQHEGLI